MYLETMEDVLGKVDKTFRRAEAACKPTCRCPRSSKRAAAAADDVTVTATRQ